MTFEVWAPFAGSVSLDLDGERLAMARTPDDWWRLPDESGIAEVGAGGDGDGIDYGYVIDDDTTVLPDPRSRRQPHGVHGSSRTFDPARHEWGDRAWTGRQLAGGVIYELHVGTFTPEGTLDAALGKLDHLVGLGVDFVELLPVNGFNGTHNWGYDGVLWYTVHESYGGPAAYQRFVDACHAAGLGVIQDVVYNHLGPSGNYLPRFGPYLHDASANTWGRSINLDGEGSKPVRRYILDNALMWLRDYHVDGLRLDAVHALVDSSSTHLLQQLAEETDVLSAHLRRPLILIAESDLNDPRLVTPREAGGYGLTAQWSDDYHHALHVNLTGETAGYYADFESLEALAKVMGRGFFHDGTWSSFRGRNHGRSIDLRTMQTWRLVTYSQDHDQVGNRASGDRLTASLNPDQLAIAAVFTLLSPYTPMLFMGEEWGASTPWQFFTSHPEPELGRATAEGRIAEFEQMGWDKAAVPDPQAPTTFTNSKLDWGELAEVDHARLLDLYRRLATLRRASPGVTDPRFGRIACSWDDTARWFRLDREGISVLANFSATGTTVPWPAGGTILLATREGVEVQPDSVWLPAHSAAVAAT